MLKHISAFSGHIYNNPAQLFPWVRVPKASTRGRPPPRVGITTTTTATFSFHDPSSRSTFAQGCPALPGPLATRPFAPRTLYAFFCQSLILSRHPHPALPAVVGSRRLCHQEHPWSPSCSQSCGADLGASGSEHRPGLIGAPVLHPTPLVPPAQRHRLDHRPLLLPSCTRDSGAVHGNSTTVGHLQPPQP